MTTSQTTVIAGDTHMSWRKPCPAPTDAEIAQAQRRKKRKASAMPSRLERKLLQFLLRYQTLHTATPKQAEMALAIGRCHTSVSQELKNLERKGCLLRDVKGEGRRCRITLTARGIAIGKAAGAAKC